MYFNFEYSWILVPLTLYLYYYYPQTRPYLLYFMVYSALIGSLNTILLRSKIVDASKDFGVYQYYLTLLFNIILLGSLSTFPTDGYPNLISLGIMIFALIFIYLTPHWPYFNSKNFFSISYIIIYVILSIAYMLLASCKLLSTGE